MHFRQIKGTQPRYYMKVSCPLIVHRIYCRCIHIVGSPAWQGFVYRCETIKTQLGRIAVSFLVLGLTFSRSPDYFLKTNAKGCLLGSMLLFPFVSSFLLKSVGARWSAYLGNIMRPYSSFSANIIDRLKQQFIRFT